MRHDQRLIAGWEALVGVDEAGRGALFGPVSAGAVLVRPGFFESRWFARRAPVVDDSKQLDPALRAGLHDEILAEAEAGTLVCASAFATVAEIEARNILGATQLAMGRALREVFGKAGVNLEAGGGLFEALVPEGEATASALLPIDRCRVLIDGKPLKSVGFAHEALVKGDAKSLVIAMASILAKVARDREVERLDRLHPGYGLAEHKGYATPTHREAILRLGSTPHHRETFLRNLLSERASDAGAQPELELG